MTLPIRDETLRRLGNPASDTKYSRYSNVSVNNMTFIDMLLTITTATKLLTNHFLQTLALLRYFFIKIII